MCPIFGTDISLDAANVEGLYGKAGFLIAAILFWAMNCLAAEIFLSLLKRMKAGNFLEGSILFLFVREIIFGKLHLGQLPGFAKRLFYELPIGQEIFDLVFTGRIGAGSIDCICIPICTEIPRSKDSPHGAERDTMPCGLFGVAASLTCNTDS